MKTQKDIARLVVVVGLSALAGLVQSVLIGRELGIAALGTFAAAVGIARIFSAGTDLGIAAHMTRVLARDRARSNDFLGVFLGFRGVLVVAGIVVTIVAAYALNDESWPVPFLIAIAVGLPTLQALYEAVFSAIGDQRSVAISVLASSTCVLGACGIWFVLHGNLLLFALIYAIGTIVSLLAIAGHARRAHSATPSFGAPKEMIRSELAKSWPIGVSLMFGIAALKSPVLIVTAFGSREDAGAFATVDMFVTATAILQGPVTAVTYPLLSASYATDPQRFRLLFWRSNLCVAGIGLVCGAMVAFFGAPVAGLVFPGKDFSRVSQLLPIVGWSAPALLLVHHNIMVFAAANRERANVGLMAGWMCIIATTQLVLVPTYGLIGSAWGILIGRTMGLLFVCGASFSFAVHRGQTRSRRARLTASEDGG